MGTLLECSPLDLSSWAKLYKNFATKMLAVLLCSVMMLMGTSTGVRLTRMTHAKTIDSGYCGNPKVNDGKNITWRLETNGNKVTVETKTQDAYTLTISGKGEMISSTCYTPPWDTSDAQITTVVIEEGVELIGYKAFEWCYNLSSVYIPSSVYSFGDEAFSKCNSLTRIYIPCDETGQSLKQLFSSDCDITEIDDADGTFTFTNSAGNQGTFVLVHDWSGGVCTRCNAVCPHSWSDDLCTVCGEAIPFFEAPVTVQGHSQRIRVYDPNLVLPSDTVFSAEYVDSSHGDHNFFIRHIDATSDVELRHYYNLTLTSDGQTLSQLNGPVELRFEVIDGIDAADSFISRVAEGADTKLEPTVYTDKYGTTWIKVLTDHFSPYALTDLLSESEKKSLAPPAETTPLQTPTDVTPTDVTPKHNVTTGDFTTQITVAGLGMTLALALGIMLRLLTNRRIFEE